MRGLTPTCFGRTMPKIPVSFPPGTGGFSFPFPRRQLEHRPHAGLGAGCGDPPTPPPQVGSTARGGPGRVPPRSVPPRSAPPGGPSRRGGWEGGRENRRTGAGARPGPARARRAAPERAAAAAAAPLPVPFPFPVPLPSAARPMARPLPLLLCLAALGAGCRAGFPPNPTGTAGPSAEPLQDEADNQENILSQVPAGEHLGMGAEYPRRGAGQCRGDAGVQDAGVQDAGRSLGDAGRGRSAVLGDAGRSPGAQRGAGGVRLRGVLSHGVR